MTTIKSPRSLRPSRPMPIKQMETMLHHAARVALHNAGRLTLSESEYSWSCDVVLAALAGRKAAPWPSMDDREEPDDDDGPALSSLNDDKEATK